ncbi:hypothetical protein TL16_g10384 [Triparma laevis f. inornata]|uniref:Uncharacterized protein n=1 Tax=Triparma laevis f. inornata TaxID=1714386 RepID=A0A9W7BGV8_9STRA|nr:hypothetical protein TL16_g10384 [Triparma laevis f. inornata]
MILWYTPVLQMIGLFYDYYEDPDRPACDDSGNDNSCNPGFYLISDPEVICNPASDGGKMFRMMVHVNSFLISLFVGIGFPYFIFWKTKQLKNAGKLNADSAFASLYQYYAPSVPYFEAIHFIRKALLICSMTVLGFYTDELASAGVEASLLQALTSVLINAGFFAILWKSKPLVFFPCSLLKNQNLNNLAELLAGNFLALIGSISNNQDAVNILGTIFAIVDLFFVSSVEDGRTTSFSRAESISEKLAVSVKEAEVDSNGTLVSLAMVGEKGKKELIAELPFIRSQFTLALEKELEKAEKEWKGKGEEEI